MFRLFVRFTVSFLILISAAIMAEQNPPSRSILQRYTAARDDGERIEIIREIGRAQIRDTAVLNILFNALKRGTSSTLRSEAAMAMGDCRAGRAELQRAFETDDIYVRTAAIKSLAIIAHPASIPIFEKGISDQTAPGIRLAGLRGLSRCGGRAHHQYFIEALQWENPEARVYAVEGLGRTGSHDDWDTIVPFCQDIEKNLVKACLTAGSLLKEPEALVFIEKYLNDRDSDLHDGAVSALSNFSGHPVIAIIARHRRSASRPLSAALTAVMKKNGAASVYAVALSPVSIMSGPGENFQIRKTLSTNDVLEVVRRDGKRYVMRSITGVEKEDFWYEVKSGDSVRGFVFGGYIDTVRIYEQ